MEELGIGRPSTYASILAVLREREYVRLEKKRLVAEDKGLLVIASSRASSRSSSNTISPPISRSSSTASRIARSTGSRSCAVSGASSRRRSARPRSCAPPRSSMPSTIPGAAHLPAARRRRGAPLLPELRHRPALAEARQVRRLHRLLELSGCRYTRQLMASGATPTRKASATKARPASSFVGEDPKPAASPPCASRFGAFCSSARRPRRATSRSARPAVRPTRSISSERSGCSPCRARSARIRNPASRSGRHRALRPYVQHGKTFANLEKDDDVAIARTVRSTSSSRAKAAPSSAAARRDPGRQLGEDPSTSKTVVVKAGRFGPMSPTAR